MSENIFLQDQKQQTLADYMGCDMNNRENLGNAVPVAIYRLLEYSLREQLRERFGKEEQIKIFRDAGYKAGEYFAKNMLDTTQDLNGFTAELQKKMEDLKIGVLRIEKYDKETGKMILTVSEDADCSGLPTLGETVCNYDEGFIAGILSVYLGKPYSSVEIDCWATGERVCRFKAEPEEG